MTQEQYNFIQMLQGGQPKVDIPLTTEEARTALMGGDGDSFKLNDILYRSPQSESLEIHHPYSDNKKAQKQADTLGININDVYNASGMNTERRRRNVVEELLSKNTPVGLQTGEKGLHGRTLADMIFKNNETNATDNLSNIYSSLGITVTPEGEYEEGSLNSRLQTDYNNMLVQKKANDAPKLHNTGTKLDAYTKKGEEALVNLKKMYITGQIDSATYDASLKEYNQFKSQLKQQRDLEILLPNQEALKDEIKASSLSYKGNIDLNNRKVLKEGNHYKTENSITIGLSNGKQAIIPTVINGVQFSKEDAVNYFSKTGEHLGIYDSIREADDAANSIHIRQKNNYKNGKYEQSEDGIGNAFYSAFTAGLTKGEIIESVGELKNIKKHMNTPELVGMYNSLVPKDEKLSLTKFQSSHQTKASDSVKNLVQDKTQNWFDEFWDDSKDVVSKFFKGEVANDPTEKDSHVYNVLNTLGDVAQKNGVSSYELSSGLERIAGFKDGKSFTIGGHKIEDLDTLEQASLDPNLSVKDRKKINTLKFIDRAFKETIASGKVSDTKIFTNVMEKPMEYLMNVAGSGVQSAVDYTQSGYQRGAAHLLDAVGATEVAKNFDEAAQKNLEEGTKNVRDFKEAVTDNPYNNEHDILTNINSLPSARNKEGILNGVGASLLDITRGVGITVPELMNEGLKLFNVGSENLDNVIGRMKAYDERIDKSREHNTNGIADLITFAAATLGTNKVISNHAYNKSLKADKRMEKYVGELGGRKIRVAQASENLMEQQKKVELRQKKILEKDPTATFPEAWSITQAKNILERETKGLQNANNKIIERNRLRRSEVNKKHSLLNDGAVSAGTGAVALSTLNRDILGENKNAEDKTILDVNAKELGSTFISNFLLGKGIETSVKMSMKRLGRASKTAETTAKERADVENVANTLFEKIDEKGGLTKEQADYAKAEWTAQYGEKSGEIFNDLFNERYGKLEPETPITGATNTVKEAVKSIFQSKTAYGIKHKAKVTAEHLKDTVLTSEDKLVLLAHAEKTEPGIKAEVSTRFKNEALDNYNVKEVETFIKENENFISKADRDEINAHIEQLNKYDKEHTVSENQKVNEQTYIPEEAPSSIMRVRQDLPLEGEIKTTNEQAVYDRFTKDKKYNSKELDEVMQVVQEPATIIKENASVENLPINANKTAGLPEVQVLKGAKETPALRAESPYASVRTASGITKADVANIKSGKINDALAAKLDRAVEELRAIKEARGEPRESIKADTSIESYNAVKKMEASTKAKAKKEAREAKARKEAQPEVFKSFRKKIDEMKTKQDFTRGSKSIDSALEKGEISKSHHEYLSTKIKENRPLEGKEAVDRIFAETGNAKYKAETIKAIEKIDEATGGNIINSVEFNKKSSKPSSYTPKTGKINVKDTAKKALNLLHETIHKAVSKALEKDTVETRNLQRIFDSLKDSKAFEGIKDIHEMVSEMYTNERVIHAMNNKRVGDIALLEEHSTSKVASVLKYARDVIVKLLGNEKIKDGTALSSALTEVERLTINKTKTRKSENPIFYSKLGEDTNPRIHSDVLLDQIDAFFAESGNALKEKAESRIYREASNAYKAVMHTETGKKFVDTFFKTMEVLDNNTNGLIKRILADHSDRADMKAAREFKNMVAEVEKNSEATQYSTRDDIANQIIKHNLNPEQQRVLYDMLTAETSSLHVKDWNMVKSGDMIAIAKRIKELEKDMPEGMMKYIDETAKGTTGEKTNAYNLKSAYNIVNHFEKGEVKAVETLITLKAVMNKKESFKHIKEIDSKLLDEMNHYHSLVTAGEFGVKEIHKQHGYTYEWGKHDYEIKTLTIKEFENMSKKELSEGWQQVLANDEKVILRRQRYEIPAEEGAIPSVQDRNRGELITFTDRTYEIKDINEKFKSGNIDAIISKYGDDVTFIFSEDKKAPIAGLRRVMEMKDKEIIYELEHNPADVIADTMRKVNRMKGLHDVERAIAAEVGLNPRIAKDNIDNYISKLHRSATARSTKADDTLGFNINNLKENGAKDGDILTKDVKEHYVALQEKDRKRLPKTFAGITHIRKDVKDAWVGYKNDFGGVDSYIAKRNLAFTRDAVNIFKNNVVVKNLHSIANNTLFNVISVSMYDMNPALAAKRTYKNQKLINEYLELVHKRKAMSLKRESQRKAGKKMGYSKEISDLAKEIDSPKFKYVKMGDENGAFQSLIDDMYKEANREYGSIIIDKISSIKEISDFVSKPLPFKFRNKQYTRGDALNEMYMNPESYTGGKIGGFLRFNDYASRITLMEHLHRKAGRNKKMQEEAIQTSLDTFVDYRKTLPHEIKYAQEYGLIPFAGWTYRMKEPIYKMARNSPIKMLASYLAFGGLSDSSVYAGGVRLQSISPVSTGLEFGVFDGGMFASPEHIAAPVIY